MTQSTPLKYAFVINRACMGRCKDDIKDIKEDTAAVNAIAHGLSIMPEGDFSFNPWNVKGEHLEVEVNRKGVLIRLYDTPINTIVNRTKAEHHTEYLEMWFRLVLESTPLRKLHRFGLVGNGDGYITISITQDDPVNPDEIESMAKEIVNKYERIVIMLTMLDSIIDQISENDLDDFICNVFQHNDIDIPFADNPLKGILNMGTDVKRAFLSIVKDVGERVQRVCDVLVIPDELVEFIAESKYTVSNEGNQTEDWYMDIFKDTVRLVLTKGVVYELLVSKTLPRSLVSPWIGQLLVALSPSGITGLISSMGIGGNEEREEFAITCKLETTDPYEKAKIYEYLAVALKHLSLIVKQIKEDLNDEEINEFIAATILVDETSSKSIYDATTTNKPC